MSEKPMFNTVRFGGFDKEEVLSFISESLEISEKKEKASQAKFKAMQEKIDLLSEQTRLLTQRNKELENNAERISENTAYSAVNQQAISQVIMKTQAACDTMIRQTRDRCSAMQKQSQIEAARMPQNLDLQEAQREYQEILQNVKTIKEITDLFEVKIHGINKMLQQLDKKLLNSESEPHR